MGYQTKNYDMQGGEVEVIGGELRIASTGKITAAGTQASTIADATAAAGSNPTKAEYDTVVTKLNAVLAALKGVGIIAGS